MFPREFVIWLKLMDDIIFAKPNLFHWIRRSNVAISIKKYTIDELYQYWLFEVENKNKEDESRN